jgi:dienelactone hydrolase
MEYKDEGASLEGRVVYDESVSGKRPVVIVFHDWFGPSDVTLDAAEKVAAAGYVAVIADIYGKGIRPASPEEAAQQSAIYKKDRALMRRRAGAVLAELGKIPQADASKVGAIGFCFGGTVALELARSGAPLLGTVTFHGGLETPDTSLAKNITGKILVLHGASDPFVPAAEVAAFEAEMGDAKVDWQLVKFSGAQHAFTNKKIDAARINGAAYNEKADRRGFQYMRDFLTESFGK